MSESELNPLQRLAEERALVDFAVGPAAAQPNPTVYQLMHCILDAKENLWALNPSCLVYISTIQLLGELSIVRRTAAEGRFEDPSSGNV